MRAVISNLIIRVVSEKHEDGEKNGQAKGTKRGLCVIQLESVGHVHQSADGSPLGRWRS